MPVQDQSGMKLNTVRIASPVDERKGGKLLSPKAELLNVNIASHLQVLGIKDKLWNKCTCT